MTPTREEAAELPALLARFERQLRPAGSNISDPAVSLSARVSEWRALLAELEAARAAVEEERRQCMEACIAVAKRADAHDWRDMRTGALQCADAILRRNSRPSPGGTEEKS